MPAAIMRLHLQGGASMNADQPLSQLICPVRYGCLMLGTVGSPVTADTGMSHANKHKTTMEIAAVAMMSPTSPSSMHSSSNHAHACAIQEWHANGHKHIHSKQHTPAATATQLSPSNSKQTDTLQPLVQTATFQTMFVK